MKDLPSVHPRVELRKLTKRLGKMQIVDGIDLIVEPGESVVLLGPSGCGKTTTLRMIAGFIKPDGGEIHLSGRIASGTNVMIPTERRQLGMVFQNYAVWPHKNVFENVAYGLVVAGSAKTDIANRVARLLDSVKLSGLEKRLPSELSGGQQQRVALARALATEPSLLLLDEPLSNLDAALRQEMRFELKDLHRRTGTTTLYVTHDQEEALVLADRIVVMNRGTVEQAGSPEDIYLRPRTRFVASFVGTTNLFRGTVKAKDEGRGKLLFETDFGAQFWAGAAPDTFDQLSEGEIASVAVRPEDILIGPIVSGAATAVPIQLKTAAFLGSRYELHLTVAGQPFRGEARSLDAFRDGAGFMSIDNESAWVVQ